MVYDYYTLQEFVGYITEESSAGYAVENICIKQIMPKKISLSLTIIITYLHSAQISIT